MVRLLASYTETSEVLMPDATNNLGRGRGGWVLHRMDIGGVIAARRFAQSQVVTASIDRVDFHAPIDLGDIVVLTAYVYDVGETSMQVRVDVTAERPSERRERETASSHLTFVAIDEDEAVRPVPDLEIESERERELKRTASGAMLASQKRS
ncbi:acyl-CoA thioesterase [Halolamina sp.]|jgi:acyl-CoA hydrolase|uniref:acyl-CoA thioesterase n=1 Tax=Halolamina sp. TaxID=1940283 RepID=UPI000223BE57|nr:thioesterase superfamily protein [halophilic archaeon DL31]